MHQSDEVRAHARSRARAIGLDTRGPRREEECVSIDARGGDAHAMVRDKAGRGPTRILRVVACPALFGVAHAGKAAEEAAARRTDAAERLHHKREYFELLDFESVVVIAAHLSDVPLARGVVKRPVSGKTARIGTKNYAVEKLESVAEGKLVSNGSWTAAMAGRATPHRVGIFER